MNSTAGHQPRVAIIGGGITGLAAAHKLIEAGSVSVHVFDANPGPGGLLTTHRVGEYLIERGADSFITNKPAGIELCLRLGLENELIRTNADFRRSLVLHNGRPVEVPRGFQLLMPTQLEPIMASDLLTAEAKQRVAAEASIPAPGALEDESVASFVRRRFGDELFDRLAQPMVGGIYTADPDKLSILATLPRFPRMEQQHGSLTRAAAMAEPEQASGARYGLFVTLRQGIGQLVDALTARITDQGGIIHSGCSVDRVEHMADQWHVTHSDKRETFDSIIVATSAWRAADVLRLESEPLAQALTGIPYASSAVVCTAHRLADIQHSMDAFGLVVPAVESRRILAVSFASRKFADRAPAGQIILRTFVGGAMQPEMLQHTDDGLVEIVQEELADIFGVRNEPLQAVVTRYNQAMPQYHLGHIDRVAVIRKLAEGMDGLELAGNAYEGVGIPDSIRSGEEAALRICERFR